MENTQPKIQHLPSSDISHITLFQGSDGRYSVTVVLKNKNVIDMWGDRCQVAKFIGRDTPPIFGALELENGKWGV